VILVIESRPVVPDKLQFHISPHFLSVDDEKDDLYSGNLSILFDKDAQSLYGSKITYFDGVRKGKKPYFQLPNDFNESTSGFLWNTRVSLRKPFTVAVDYNFIRHILTLVKADPESGYDQRYHESVQLHDDNFIDERIWSNWDSYLIPGLETSFKDMLLSFANSTFRYLVPDHELVYSHVSLKHAEFNIDYNVGSNNSLALILAFQRFIFSDRGSQWRSELESMSMVQRCSKTVFDKDITSQDGNDGHTFKFYISKGLSFKVYQKSTDHIRAELVFDGSFIKRMLGKYDVDVVYPALLQYSKDFFKEINFDGILYLLSKHLWENRNNIEKKVYAFFGKYDSGLLSILDCVVHEQGVSDRRLITRISCDPKLRSLFKRDIDQYGNPVYLYDPYNRGHRIRRLKPAPKKKLMPSWCSSCSSYYHSDLTRCPYCEEKNPKHDIAHDTKFLEFMAKVRQYKDGGYRGF
jgi:hypothetical protein